MVWLLLSLLFTQSLGQDDIVCPGGSFCPQEMTCCHIGPDLYGCCLFSAATCCTDYIHCCPHGMKCNLKKQSCDSNSISHPFGRSSFVDWMVRIGIPKKKHLLEGSEIQLGKEMCPDGIHTCNDSTQCCKSKHGYACCRHLNAVCCSDGLHCCPADTVCDSEQKMCVSEGLGRSLLHLLWAITPAKLLRSTEMMNEVESQKLLAVEGPFALSEVLSGGRTCCSGGHCCPQGYQCFKDDMCWKQGRGVISLFFFAKLPATYISEHQVHANATCVECSDGGKCPDGNTCCKMDENVYGCCPLENATCCPDGIFCCPHGFKCANTGKCIFS